MASSKYSRYFQTNTGTPLIGARIWIVPQANTYPTNALELTAHGTRNGIYERAAVPHGEYKIYIDTAGGTSPGLYEENLWFGTADVSEVLGKFNEDKQLVTTGIDDDAITKEKIAPDIAGGGIAQNADGSLEVDGDTTEFEIASDDTHERPVLKIKESGIQPNKINNSVVGKGLTRNATTKAFEVFPDGVGLEIDTNNKLKSKTKVRTLSASGNAAADDHTIIAAMSGQAPYTLVLEDYYEGKQLIVVNNNIVVSTLLVNNKLGVNIAVLQHGEVYLFVYDSNANNKWNIIPMVKDGSVLPTKLATQTKTVTSVTDPVPDYVGQPGRDGSGNRYIAIAKTGTMWEKVSISDLIKSKTIQGEKLTDNKCYSVVYSAAKQARSKLKQSYVLSAVGDYLEYEVKQLTGVIGNYGTFGFNKTNFTGIFNTQYILKFEGGAVSETWVGSIQPAVNTWTKIKLLVVATGIELFMNNISQGIKTAFIPGTSKFTIQNIGDQYTTEYANIEIGEVTIHSSASGDFNVNNIALVEGIESVNVSLSIKQSERSVLTKAMLGSISSNFSSYYAGSGQSTLLPKKYILNTTGDYVEFDVKISDWSSNRSMGIIGDSKFLGSHIGFYTQGNLYVRNSAGTWIETGAFPDIRNSMVRLKFIYDGTSLKVFLNNALSKTIVNAGTFEIDCIGVAYGQMQTSLMNFKNLTIHSSTSGDYSLPNPALDETISNYGVGVTDDGDGFLTTAQKNLLNNLQLDSYESKEIVVIKTNGNIKVYVKGSNPNSNKYICYNLQLLVDAPTNTNSWNLKPVAEFTRTGEFTFVQTALGNIIVGGEWETAIMIQGEVDFMGGHIHGDEILTFANLLIDGQQKDLTTAENFRCTEVRFIQSSQLRKPSTNANVCYHLREHIISSEGLRLKQNYTWNSVETLTLSYLAMCPVARVNEVSNQITDTCYRDDDYILDDVSAANFAGGVNEQTANKVKTINIWGTNSGIGISLEIIKIDPIHNNTTFFVSNAAQYNKLYYNYTGINSTHVTQIGEKWNIEAIYRILTKN